MGFLKALLEKKIVINIESKDSKEREAPMSMSRLNKIGDISASKFW